jgi:hypothetical protein
MGDGGHSQLATTADAQVGRGTPQSFTAGIKVRRVRTRRDVSCRELIDVVQATDYRVAMIFRISAETETEVLLDRAVRLSDRSVWPPMIEVRNVHGQVSPQTPSLGWLD